MKTKSEILKMFEPFRKLAGAMPPIESLGVPITDGVTINLPPNTKFYTTGVPMPKAEVSANPELDEATAVALCILIDNQIAALEGWKKKLKLPYMPNNDVTYIHMQVHPFPKPTVKTAGHLCQSLENAGVEVARITLAYAASR